MSRQMGVFAVVFCLVLLSASPDTAGAETIVVSERITITASVKATRYVIVDRQGVVEQVISNNSLTDIEPEVYVGSVHVDNRQSATPEILKAIDELLEGKTIKPGILYDRKTEPVHEEKINLKQVTLSATLGKVFGLKSF